MSIRIRIWRSKGWWRVEVPLQTHWSIFPLKIGTRTLFLKVRDYFFVLLYFALFYFIFVFLFLIFSCYFHGLDEIMILTSQRPLIFIRRKRHKKMVTLMYNPEKVKSIHQVMSENLQFFISSLRKWWWYLNKHNFSTFCAMFCVEQGSYYNSIICEAKQAIIIEFMTDE